MGKHLERDLTKITNEILLLGNMVESAINNALLSVTHKRKELAEIVLKKATEIDIKEVNIEDYCLKILALHQPVAADLRFIVVVLKVNNDLERMGDFTENLAHRSLFLNSHDAINMPTDFTEKLPELIKVMVRNALDSLVNLDVNLARAVISMDNQVDEIHKNMYKQMQALMEKNSSSVEACIQLLSCSRYIERIADLTTNIAEEVVFLVEGETIRHQDKELIQFKEAMNEF